MSKTKIKNWALPYVTNKRCYIDVGANDGDTSVPFVNIFDRIIAFEPNPDTFAKIPHGIEKYNVALSDFVGHTNLVLPKATKPEWGSIAARRMENWNGKSHQVAVTTLDSYDFLDVDFIKIDVEQGELEVVKGAMNTIIKNKPLIMFENKRNENDIVIEILSEIGYTIKKHTSDTIAYFASNNGD